MTKNLFTFLALLNMQIMLLQGDTWSGRRASNARPFQFLCRQVHIVRVFHLFYTFLDKNLIILLR